MLSKWADSFAGSFCESKIVASKPSSFARFRAVSANTTNHGLFKVDTTTATRRASGAFPVPVAAGAAVSVRLQDARRRHTTALVHARACRRREGFIRVVFDVR